MKIKLYLKFKISSLKLKILKLLFALKLKKLNVPHPKIGDLILAFTVLSNFRDSANIF